jgi:hypothetical protein
MLRGSDVAIDPERLELTHASEPDRATDSTLEPAVPA